ncbi:lysylphosphatidylglycerol synthase domain-containing protein [Lederbergia sp. NSJ-179]|uniref:lysylphosphatidylglycerol synthase domain-containing protein n=1 Tax=Lederbergia sp. NSJ-179 TaxID=2931402 RepID=UPI001FCFAFC2|nr:lysylphosphatidylglycerol synthase domain-containing protein [Lederbergia sp. NSJ-179]MCJ7842790.1 lysylphosphatidylglycerol synthase domain-containing protein [Lederbergia sp. NSJ-179]
MLKNKQLFVRIGKIAFMVLVLSIIFIQGKSELQDVSLKESLQVINQISFVHMTILIIVALLSVGTMFFYDYFFIRSQELTIQKRKIFNVSWIANSFNGIFGFGGLIGAGIRGMLYKKYSEKGGELGKGIAWLAPAAAMGLSVFAILALIGIFPIRGILAGKSWILLVLVAVSLLSPLYIGLSRWKKTSYFSPLITVQYSLVSVLEWFGAGLVLYLSFVFAGIHLSFLLVFGIFIIAAITGFISMIPGGFGSFDLMVLSSGQLYGIESEPLLTALFLYRFVYYLIPFIIGLILAAIEMASTAIKKSEDSQIVTPVIEISSVVWTLQRQALIPLGYWSLSLLAFISGFFLITIPIFDIISIHGLEKSKLSLFTLDFYYLVLFACGITLWFLMKEQYYQTKRSWQIVSVTLAISIILLLFQSENFIIGLLAAFHLLVLILLRKQFRRHSLPFTAASVRKLLYLCIGCFFGFVLLAREGLLATGYDKPLYGIYGLAFTGCLVAFIYIVLSIIFFDKRHQPKIGEAYSAQKLTEFLQKYGGACA